MKTRVPGAPIIIWVLSAVPLTGVCALSVAVTEKEKEPTAVGVPDTDPSDPTVSPGGTVPVACQV